LSDPSRCGLCTIGEKTNIINEPVVVEEIIKVLNKDNVVLADQLIESVSPQEMGRRLDSILLYSLRELGGKGKKLGELACFEGIEELKLLNFPKCILPLKSDVKHVIEKGINCLFLPSTAKPPYQDLFGTLTSTQTNSDTMQVGSSGQEFSEETILSINSVDNVKSGSRHEVLCTDVLENPLVYVVGGNKTCNRESRNLDLREVVKNSRTTRIKGGTDSYWETILQTAVRTCRPVFIIRIHLLLPSVSTNSKSVCKNRQYAKAFEKGFEFVEPGTTRIMGLEIGGVKIHEAVVDIDLWSLSSCGLFAPTTVDALVDWFYTAAPKNSETKKHQVTWDFVEPYKEMESSEETGTTFNY